jgi:hypothetical protein
MIAPISTGKKVTARISGLNRRMPASVSSTSIHAGENVAEYQNKRKDNSASHRCWHRYSCQLSHQPLSDTLLVGTRKRALMSLRVRLEGFASYSPFSIAMLLPLFLP